MDARPVATTRLGVWTARCGALEVREADPRTWAWKSASGGTPPRHHSARGFSLLELIVVLAVTVVLTGLMLPALNGVRENVNQVVCSSNLRQLGLGFTMYARDYNERLPHTRLLRGEPQPWELMSAHLGGEGGGWDGVGLLFSEGYCEAPDCYYCPSHRGTHSLEENRDRWWPSAQPQRRLYTNYHYCGDVEWEDTRRRRRLEHADRLILATDGFRTAEDINHVSGMNMLRGDGSVRWREDGDRFADLVAQGEGSETYHGLWRKLDEP
jgi:prepilin-type N-terminal cleavage/methylation domain-containing protein